jgi:nitrogen fixation protein NifU and related proteins
MPSERLLDHFRNPRNVGDLAEPALRIEVVNPACGDILRLSATVEGGRVLEVRYKARGCPASIAAGSALTELIQGRTESELQAISAQEVEAAVGGLEPASKHAAQLCVDAVSALVAKCDLK